MNSVSSVAASTSTPIAEEVFGDVSPIFVVGAPRSGTTLLERMIDAHPAISITDELCFFDIVLQISEEVPDLRGRANVDALMSRLPQMDHFRNWNGIDTVLEEVGERLAGDPKASYQRLFLQLMQVYAGQQGARRFGDKTPWNVRHLPTLLRWFPDARIIHLVRDPRANVASKIDLPRTSGDVLTATVKWRMDVDAGDRFEASGAIPADHFLTVRYEDLVQESERVARRICDTIGEDFAPEMLTFHRRRDVMFKDQPWKEGVLRPMSTGSLDAWRERLPPVRSMLIELVAGSAMRRHDYRADPRGLRRWLAVPAQLVREFAMWRRFKREERERRKAEPETRFVADNRGFYKLALESLGLRRPPPPSPRSNTPRRP
ncbi:MAG: sulfotransferase [Geminicoccaceae bacterium]